MKYRRGFTLIELLVVIAIISILAAMLFPVFATARAKGRQISCLSNLRQIGMAIALYQQDYGGLFPASNWAASGSPPAPPFDVTTGGLFPYIRSQGVYVCSTDSEGSVKGLSYELNANLLSMPEASLDSHSTTVVLLDAKVDDSVFVVGSLEDDAAVQAFTSETRDQITGDAMNADHLDTANVLWADGHVSSARYGQVTTAMFDR
ncbi:MAG: type II secretion system protein [Armatimonadetes bacterium]|nr:type II secretion system protein [Armatimonadota bacterium]